MSKNSGFLVEHKDGRQGIARHSDQTQKFHDEGKTVVQFHDEKFKPVGPKKAVRNELLTTKGFVD